MTTAQMNRNQRDADALHGADRADRAGGANAADGTHAADAANAATGPAVRVRGLTKRYRVPAAVRRQAKGVQGKELPEETAALKDVNIEVARGEIYGVLGPNGAGKTTLMKVLATILLPDEGTVEILGQDAVTHAAALRYRIGIVLGEYERSFHWRLTGRQNLRFFADFYAIPASEQPGRIERALETVGLSEAADKRFNEYSTGMKHRLALARGLLPDPDLLILDEPTAGLDATSSQQIRDTVRALAAAGTTILYTSHRIHEAGFLCDRILVLDGGKTVMEATPADLAKLARGSQVVELNRVTAGPWRREFVEPLVARKDVADWETRGERLLLYTTGPDGGAQAAAAIASNVRAQDDSISITIRPPSVEDAFLSLIAGSAGSAPVGGARSSAASPRGKSLVERDAPGAGSGVHPVTVTPESVAKMTADQQVAVFLDLPKQRWPEMMAGLSLAARQRLGTALQDAAARKALDAERAKDEAKRNPTQAAAPAKGDGDAEEDDWDLDDDDVEVGGV